MSKYYSINEFSKILGVSAQTLRNWDNNGKLHRHHTSSNGYRYCSHEQLNQVINVKPNLDRKIIGYCRVSSNKQKIDCKYSNPRITFDGQNWFVSVGIECEESYNVPINNGIGIDVGIKDLAICSDIDKPYKNINKTHKARKLEKKKRKLQRKISRKYIMNKKGVSYCKTSNIIKSEKELLKLNHRLTNIRNNYIHQTTAEIINRKPIFIVLEDLNITGMMKNKHLSKAIQQQKLYEFHRQIKYKAKWNNIKFIEADRYFPSSKTCNSCGHINKYLKLSDRTFVCPVCGVIEDRDKNASYNLRDYGYKIIKSIA